MRGWYRAQIEQLFAHLWHWGLIEIIWCGGPNKVHQSVHILLHFTQFCIRRQVCHFPYGLWDHVPPHVWKSIEATVDDATQEDEVDMCIVLSKAHYNKMW